MTFICFPTVIVCVAKISCKRCHICTSFSLANSMRSSTVSSKPPSVVETSRFGATTKPCWICTGSARVKNGQVSRNFEIPSKRVYLLKVSMQSHQIESKSINKPNHPSINQNVQSFYWFIMMKWASSLLGFNFGALVNSPSCSFDSQSMLPMRRLVITSYQAPHIFMHPIIQRSNKNGTKAHLALLPVDGTFRLS